MTWMDRAACRGVDPDLFFPKTNAHSGWPNGRRGPESENSFTEPRAVCARCPVREECLHAAMLEENEAGKVYRFGMRGGLTPAERYMLARERRRRWSA